MWAVPGGFWLYQWIVTLHYHLVGGLEHEWHFLSIQLGIIIPTDELIFFSWNHHYTIIKLGIVIIHYNHYGSPVLKQVTEEMNLIPVEFTHETVTRWGSPVMWLLVIKCYKAHVFIMNITESILAINLNHTSWSNSPTLSFGGTP